MLVDANILLYAVDEVSMLHARTSDWLEAALNGDARVGIPWQSMWAFLRIATNPRAMTDPLAPSAAWDIVQAWMDAPAS